MSASVLENQRGVLRNAGVSHLDSRLDSNQGQGKRGLLEGTLSVFLAVSIRHKQVCGWLFRRAISRQGTGRSVMSSSDHFSRWGASLKSGGNATLSLGCRHWGAN